MNRIAEPNLTRRERDVLIALCRPAASSEVFVEPASVREIAHELVVTDAAVKQHLQHLYDKFGIAESEPRRRLALAREALRREVVSLPGRQTTGHPPPTRYVDCNGVKVAWQVFGEGPAEIVFVSGWVSNVDLYWQYPQPRAFFSALAGFARVAVYDKPGTGASDPVDVVPPAEERIEQLVRVMDAAGLKRPVLVGISEGGVTACLTAAARPDRVGGLVMLNATSCLFDQRARVDMSEAEHEAWRELIRRTAETWGEGRDGDVWLAGVPDADRAWGVLQRACASPAVARGYYGSWAAGLTAFDVLPTIRQPTLILQRTHDRVVPIEAARVTAKRIPGARMVELQGAEHLPWLGEASQVIAELRRFVGAMPPTVDAERVLAAILCVEPCGDSDRYGQIVADGLARFGGRQIESTRPGILAVFSGPARAAEAARWSLETLLAEGLASRAGVHVGEIELRGDEVAGSAVDVAVHIASRAPQGEVLVSRTVRDLAAGSHLRFEERGDYRLDGITDDFGLYALA